MPSAWALPPTGATIEADGVLKLSNGAVFTLSDVPGKIGGKAWRDKSTPTVQALMDSILTQDDLQTDDPDKTADAITLLSIYGERRTLRGGDLVDRSTIFSWEMDGPNLLPVFRRAR